jgi:hypothetical protein
MEIMFTNRDDILKHYADVVEAVSLLGDKDAGVLGLIKKEALMETIRFFNSTTEEIVPLIDGTVPSTQQSDLLIIKYYYEHLRKSLAAHQ